MKIKLYRHKVHKNLYLKRNWHIMGSPEAEWWSATDKLYEALQSYKGNNRRSKDMIIKINPKYGCKFKLEELLKIIEEESK